MSMRIVSALLFCGCAAGQKPSVVVERVSPPAAFPMHCRTPKGGPEQFRPRADLESRVTLRVHDNLGYIRVSGRGAVPFVISTAPEKRGCRQPDPAHCVAIELSAFEDALLRRIHAFGLPNASSGMSTFWGWRGPDWKVAEQPYGVHIDDWKDATSVVEILAEALDAWGASESMSVLVEPIPCVVAH